ncbi:YbaB/EbfC family nucleoid-associated protein [Nocardia blacklockiae]|uniref:YbaB/EbfC family nucleoid-associated protein n=1 Tax=Nocardia blacklockiae TaxID=480036 RepID=UPI0018956295|nr:YbaB/EbfC family nucleoid-associated protein [Nocardia blacklockiae]MBF6174205.1 YbaB/EbfC family nucleoid-associated protein [Nocardia blacklockiae]
MDDRSLDDLTAATAEMKRLVSALLDGLDQQREDLPGVRDRLAAARSSAWSADRLAEVTVDAYGRVVDVRLSADAFRAGPPARLARSLTEAARAAAEAAHRRRAEILAPITGPAEILPDLPDLFPGAPGLRDIRETVESATRTTEPDRRANSDADED